MKVLLMLLLVSCGKLTHKITPVKVDSKIGPDFAAASKFCDNRYGYKTEESEKCFQEYKDYLKVKISFDFDGVVSFCEDRYTSNNDINECVDDFVDLIGSY